MELTKWIAARHYAAVEHKIDEFNKKAEKLSCPPFQLEKLQAQERKFRNRDGDLYYETWYEIKVSGEIPKLGGWVLVAQLENTGHGNIIRSLGQVEIDFSPYRSGWQCDHCHTERFRNFTYVVYNEETGETKQVGSQCLKDFTGHDPRTAIDMIGFVNQFYGDPDDFIGVKMSHGFYTVDFLARTFEWVRAYGFVSRAVARDQERLSTAAIIEASYDGYDWSRIVASLPANAFRPGPTDEGVRQAKVIIEHFQNITADNDYLHNLNVLAHQDYFEDRNSGFVASMVSAYNKSIEKEKEKEEAKPSEFVGAVKDKVEFTGTISNITGWDSQFGWTNLYIFTSDEGNVLVWKTGTLIQFDHNGNRRNPQKGDRVKVKGTVKQHTTYREVKQTVLTRCSMEQLTQ